MKTVWKLEDEERWITQLPIQTCIDHAIVMFRTPQCGDHYIIILVKVLSAMKKSRIAANVVKCSIEICEDIEYETLAMDNMSSSGDFGKAKTR